MFPPTDPRYRAMRARRPSGETPSQLAPAAAGAVMFVAAVHLAAWIGGAIVAYKFVEPRVSNRRGRSR